ncbi:hypothetical protein BKA15_001008 [Microlunatus parietis]|uniref:Uncharacterized protein n=1 Tax=Microlunatus parietis TaxID=682979 RepID=A0A7Y9I4F5_9ACTN|nr:hypothetical protein [Microlunatus parietis]
MVAPGRRVPRPPRFLPSGLSPSVVEFHHINRPSGRVADCHRRFGLAPTPEHARAERTRHHILPPPIPFPHSADRSQKQLFLRRVAAGVTGRRKKTPVRGGGGRGRRRPGRPLRRGPRQRTGGTRRAGRRADRAPGHVPGWTKWRPRATARPHPRPLPAPATVAAVADRSNGRRSEVRPRPSPPPGHVAPPPPRSPRPLHPSATVATVAVRRNGRGSMEVAVAHSPSAIELLTPIELPPIDRSPLQRHAAETAAFVTGRRVFRRGGCRGGRRWRWRSGRGLRRRRRRW